MMQPRRWNVWSPLFSGVVQRESERAETEIPIKIRPAIVVGINAILNESSITPFVLI
jgi:hypothetical protein